MVDGMPESDDLTEGVAVDENPPSFAPDLGSATEQAAGQVDETSAAPPTLRERLASEGFQFGETDDDSAAQERLIEAWKQQKAADTAYQQQLADLQAKAQFAEQLQNQLYDPEYIRWRQAQQAQQQSQQSPTGQAPSSWWDRPQVDETLVNQFYEQTPDGLAPKANAPLELQVQVERLKAWDAQWTQDLVRNGDKAFHRGVIGTLKSHPEILHELIGPYLQQQLQQRESSGQTQSFIDTQVAQNTDWMFQKDPVTNELRYDHNGYPVHTEQGQKFSGFYEEAFAKTNDAKWSWRAAYAQMAQEYGDPKRAQAKSAVQVSREKFMRQAGAAAGLPDRNGSNAPAELQVAQNPQRSPGRDFLSAYRD